MKKFTDIYEKIKVKVKKYFKYIIAFIIFTIAMLFGKYSYVNKILLNNSVRSLEKEKARYEEEIVETKNRLHQLKNNSGDLERFAREQYLMHKENEEIFIIQDKE